MLQWQRWRGRDEGETSQSGNCEVQSLEKKVKKGETKIRMNFTRTNVQEKEIETKDVQIESLKESLFIFLVIIKFEDSG
jgi:hypothetical protein